MVAQANPMLCLSCPLKDGLLLTSTNLQSDSQQTSTALAGIRSRCSVRLMALTNPVLSSTPQQYTLRITHGIAINGKQAC